MGRHSFIEININAIKRNLELLKSFLLNKQKIMGIVKADGYGLGAVKMTEALIDAGVNFFGVACIKEAIELRKNHINQPILVLSPFFEEEIPEYLNNNIIPTITDYQRAKLFSDSAFKKKFIAPIHVKIDTGMGRLGIWWEEAIDEVLKISSLNNLKLEGIFSHFPVADLLDDFTREQINIFKNVCTALEEKKISFIYKHIANSSGIIAFNDPYFNLVRPGILIYGTTPSEKIKELIYPEISFNWKTKIIEVKTLKKGNTISYGRTYQLSEDKKIAVIPVGYSDGFSTLNSNNGLVYIKETPCPILGRVCMDYFMVDVSKTGAELEDEVIIYGDYDGIRIDEVAKRNGLISYEILTGMSKKIQRDYHYE